MRNYSSRTCGAAIAGFAGLVAPFISGLDVSASDASSRRNVRPAAAQPVFNPDHQSVLRISERDGLPLHRGIKLGRNKSMLVELPGELRDVIVSNPEIVDAVVQSSNRVYLIGK
jgi:pilus assembly protein CpaC